MTKEDADHYVAHSLYSLVERASEETESILHSSSGIAERIPQLTEAFQHLQAAENLLQQAITHVHALYYQGECHEPSR